MFDNANGMGDMIDRMWQMYIELRQKELKTLPERVRAYFDLAEAYVTPEFVEGLAVAAYMTVVSAPTLLLSIVPLLHVARDLMIKKPGHFTVDHLHSLMQKGFAAFSPLMAQATTPEVVRLAVRLSLNDWLDTDSTSGEALESDAHMYLRMAMDILKTQPDKEAMKAEAERVVPSISDEDAARLSPRAQEALERLRKAFGGSGVTS